MTRPEPQTEHGVPLLVVTIHPAGRDTYRVTVTRGPQTAKDAVYCANVLRRLAAGLPAEGDE